MDISLIVPLLTPVLSFIIELFTKCYARNNDNACTELKGKVDRNKMIRKELADILPHLHVTLEKYLEDIDDKTNPNRGGEFDPEYGIELQHQRSESLVIIAFPSENKIYSRIELLKKLYNLRTLLNAVDDKEIIGIVDYFIDFYTEYKYVSKLKVTEAKGKANYLKIQIGKHRDCQ